MAAQIFISYSHEDMSYLKKGSLVEYLKTGLKRSNVKFWSDKDLETGDMWDEKIKQRINESNIALVLVSQAFLNSDYCTDVEISQFLERAKIGGLIIFPIILSPCEWESYDWLKSRQFLPGGDRTIEEHYTKPGPRKRLYLNIMKERKKRSAQFSDPYSKAFGKLSSSVNIINKLDPKIRTVITGKPAESAKHRIMYEGKETELVGTRYNIPVKVIKYKDLKNNLTSVDVRHVMHFHKALMFQYNKWEEFDSKRLNQKTGLVRKNIDRLQRKLIKEMKVNLNRIINYLQQIGFDLDDHYAEIHHLINSFK